jgi:parallel beta-helix repeat protein
MDLRLTALPAALALALFALWPAQASATHVQCGDTITQDTTLDNDLTDCPGDGIVIGADRITLDLNGHSVTGRGCPSDAQSCVHQSGVLNEGHDRVEVRNGTIGLFENGVLVENASRNEVSDLGISHAGVSGAPGTGISLLDSDRAHVASVDVQGGETALLLVGSDRNLVEENILNGFFAIHGGTGLVITGGSDENRVTDNDIEGEADGFFVISSRRNLIKGNDAYGFSGDNELANAERTVVVGNTLRAGNGVALTLRASEDSVVRDNLIPGGLIGIYVTGGVDNLIRSNVIADTHENDGILVEPSSQATRIEDNFVTFADDDGIEVRATGTLVRRNTANDNADLGIEAVPGVIDGGGNRASGNGNPLQCLNVFCK